MLFIGSRDPVRYRGAAPAHEADQTEVTTALPAGFLPPSQGQDPSSGGVFDGAQGHGLCSMHQAFSLTCLVWDCTRFAPFGCLKRGPPVKSRVDRLFLGGQWGQASFSKLLGARTLDGTQSRKFSTWPRINSKMPFA